MNHKFLRITLILLALIPNKVTFAKDIVKTQNSTNFKRVKNCPFCEILNENNPNKIIDQDEYVTAIKKNRQPTKEHPVDFLIIPKKHIENIKALNENDDYDSNLGSRIWLMAKKLSKKLSGSQDFKLINNNGAEADQTIFHLHTHFISTNNWK